MVRKGNEAAQSHEQLLPGRYVELRRRGYVVIEHLLNIFFFTSIIVPDRVVSC